MKFLHATFILSIALLATNALAREPRLRNEAMKVKDSLSTHVFDIKGVNAIGLTACDSLTGEVDLRGDVYCVVIGTETKAAAERVEKHYPSGSRVDGIYVWIEVYGEIRRHARISGSN